MPSRLPQPIKCGMDMKNHGKAKKDNKHTKGSASQYYVAAELSRRGMVAALTLGNCPTTDILCSNVEGTSFAHIQVKTFIKGKTKCAVGLKAQIDNGSRFFWVLVGIPTQRARRPVYYIISSSEMAAHVKASFDLWCNAKGKTREHDKANSVRVVYIPPKVSRDGWDISPFRARWSLIVKQLNA